MLRYLLVTIVFAAQSATAQIHVGPGQPYPTIYAVSKAHAAHPGDTIYVHAGIYRDTQGPIDSLVGTADKWITITPFEQDSVSIHVQYTFQRAQFLRVRGLHFEGNDPLTTTSVYHQLYFDYAFTCDSSIHDIIIENCTFSHLDNTGKQSSGASLKLTGTRNFLISNCSFRNAQNTADGISFNGDHNGSVEHCVFENLPGNGSHCKGGSQNITYHANTFTNCVSCGIDVGGDTGPQFFCPLGAAWEADSIKVFANIFIGGLTGIKLSDCHNSEIYNNTCFKTTQFAFRSLNASQNGFVLFNNRVYNNIFTTQGPYGIYMNASNNFDYSTEYFRNNLFHDYARPDPAAISWGEMPGVDASGSIIGDPLFRDTLNRDFSLLKGSPATGSGIAVSEPKTDAAGSLYFVASRSIGARESNLADVSTAEVSHLMVSPNPCVDNITIASEEIVDIRIFDPLGREVQVPVIHQTSAMTIKTQSLASGSYLMSIRLATGEKVTRLILKH